MSVQMATEQDEMSKYNKGLAEYNDCSDWGGEGCIEPIEPIPAERKKNSILVYDPGIDDDVSYEDFAEKYGIYLAGKAAKARANGMMLDTADLMFVLDIHNGKRVKGEHIERSKKQPQKERKKTSQFNMISFERLDNLEYLKNYASKSLVYERLRRFTVRGKQNDDELGLYEKYYKNGKLVSCLSQRRLAKEFGKSVNTINKYIKELVSDGVIKVIVVPAKDAWDGKKHHIYKLGTHKDGDEMYYMDEKYGLS